MRLPQRSAATGCCEGIISAWKNNMGMFTSILFFVIIVFNIVIYATQTSSNFLVSGLRYIYIKHEYYRLLTCELIHLNLMHIVFNMLALIWLGSKIERHFGTTFFIYSTFVIGFVSNVLFLFFDFVLYKLPDWEIDNYPITGQGRLRMAVGGYSNILFGYFMLSVSGAEDQNIRCFGFNIKRIFIPLIYLLLMVIIAPGSSFLGHLFGLLTGYLFLKGFFTVCCFKKEEKIFESLDNMCCCCSASTKEMLLFHPAQIPNIQRLRPACTRPKTEEFVPFGGRPTAMEMV